VSGKTGGCSAIPSGSDPDNECATVCGGNGQCTSGNHLFSARYGDFTLQQAADVVVDAAGNIVMVGTFRNELDFGNGVKLVNPGDEDVFIAKFDSNGQIVFAKRFGESGYQYGKSIAVDTLGNIYISGDCYTSIDFGGGILTTAGDSDAFVAAFTPSGAYKWAKLFGSSAKQHGDAVSASGGGNVVLAGSYFDKINLGGNQLSSKGGRDIFVAQFDSLGNHQWSKSFGDTLSDQAHDVAVDRSDNVVLVGEYAATVDFGGGPLTSVLGSLDVFVVKLSASNGSHIWSKGFGDASTEDRCNSVSADSKDSVLITGAFSGGIDFGGGPLTATAGAVDLYVAKLDSAGTHLWSQGHGGPAVIEEGFSIGVDPVDNVVVAGDAYGSLDLGGGTLVHNGGSDAFLLKLTPEGGHLWGALHGDASSEHATGVAAPGGGVWWAGHFQQTIDLGGGSLTSQGLDDIFLAKYEP